MKADFKIMLIIQLVSLIETEGQVSILQGSDCKFYSAVSLQLCKFTDDQGDASYEN
jgi:hypothetical protein